MPTAIEGKPNVEYTFSVLQKNIPDNALFRWFVDPQFPVELQTSQSFHYIFSEDGFYFVTLEVVDKEISKIIATAKLKVVVPFTLLIIFVLLYLTFSRFEEAFLIMATLPFALVGGIWLLYLLDYNLSVAGAVGFIALAGVSAEFGVIMLLYLKQAWQRRVELRVQ